MMRLLLSSVLLVIQGCSTTPDKPPVAPNVVTVTVEKLVYMPCPITMPKRPTDCTVAANATDAEWLQCTLANALRARPYILELEAALRICAAD